MARKPRWKEEGIIDGIGVVRLFSWKYFTDYIYQRMLDYETYIWRGQRCDNWKLTSTLDRIIIKSKIAKTKRSNFADTHLDQFKYATRGRRGEHPTQTLNENDWWALGQHHGLATPLLDWTTAPFVAAYFAFIGKGEKQTKHRALFALHRPSIEATVLEIKSEQERKNQEELKAHYNGTNPIHNFLRIMSLEEPAKPEIEFILPMSDENQRLVNQGGLFTKTPIGEDLETWIQRNYKGYKRYILMKILIPNKDRELCLRTLNRMNINHLTLFPDIFGASMFCNTHAEIDKY
jgi:hypothetical protein